jgi:hypothetical protein
VNVEAGKSLISNVMTGSEAWTEGDIIKNPATQEFVTYSNDRDAFVGMFNSLDYHHIYMAYAKNGNIMRVSGNPIEESKMVLTLKGNGEWSPLPCLLQQATSLTDALASYYDHATPGDLIKSHEQFAVFSSNKRWEGDLKTLRPGEGYLFKRIGATDVTVPFYNSPANAPKKAPAAERAAFRANSATNMTMIATVEGLADTGYGVRVYIGDELVGVATPLSLEGRAGEGFLYFLTIQSDRTGTLRFEAEDGTPLMAEQPVSNIADAHHGSLKAPMILKPGDDRRPYKMIENDHVVIIKNGDKYDIVGKKLK